MTVLRSGVSSMVVSTAASTEFKSPAKLRVQASGPVAYSYLQFGLPRDLHKGATVLSAKLRISQAAQWPGGAITMTVHRLGDPWKLSTVNYGNKPKALAAASDVAVTKSNTPANGVWEFDVAADVQAWVNAGKNYGWRLTTTSTVVRYIWGFAASKFKPTLEVTYTYGPVPPTSLNPSFGAVSVAKPHLDFDAGDFDALHVQVDPAANATTPAFDSGWVTTDLSEFDLATSTYPGLADGASTQWRVQVRDADGKVSGWSQWASFSRVSKPALTISQPTGTVTEASPPIVFSMPGMVDWQVKIALASDPKTILYDSGKKHSTVGEHTPPDIITKDGAAYVVTVQAWDAVNREGTTGDPKWVEASVTTTLAYSSTVAGVDWLTLDQQNPAPWVDVKWGRSIQPDKWAIIRDGVRVGTVDFANDANVGGSTYVWRDWTAAPNREHVYKVLPLVTGVTSSLGPEEVITPECVGVWLVDPVSGAHFNMGAASLPSQPAEEATTYYPIGASAAVRVLTSKRGIEGPVSGVIEDWGGRTCFEYEADLRLMESNPDSGYRLVAADINIPVTAGDFTCVPAEDTLPAHMRKAVSFSVLQTGELPFTVDL